MNFLTAFLHAATLRKGLRRTVWPTGVWLIWNKHQDNNLWWNVLGHCREIRLCQINDFQQFYDMSPEDLNANDWEVV